MSSYKVRKLLLQSSGLPGRVDEDAFPGPPQPGEHLSCTGCHFVTRVELPAPSPMTVSESGHRPLQKPRTSASPSSAPRTLPYTWDQAGALITSSLWRRMGRVLAIMPGLFPALIDHLNEEESQVGRWTPWALMAECIFSHCQDKLWGTRHVACNTVRIMFAVWTRPCSSWGRRPSCWPSPQQHVG